MVIRATTDTEYVYEPSGAEEDELRHNIREAMRQLDHLEQNDQVIWKAQSGFQTIALSCPHFEVLHHGPRGGGKTDVSLMDFAKDTGVGHGYAWRGILLRQTYPQLGDVVAKSLRWFPQMFPEARFNRSRMEWVFPDGEILIFRHMMRPEDYWNYHGHEYPWMKWEELTNWPNAECYKLLLSCCRPPRAGVPQRTGGNSNPYGVGTEWVKDRWNLAGQWRETIIIPIEKQTEDEPQRYRVAIHSHLDENKILLEADPGYKSTIADAVKNDAMRDAWLEGDWDISVGGMFGDVWDTKGANIFPKIGKVSKNCRIIRSFDWGSSAPFSVGWWLVCDGSDIELADGSLRPTLPNDMILLNEWYGYTGRPNEGLRMLAVEVAAGIIEREILWGWRDGDNTIVQPGPADTSIFTVENGVSIANDMAKPLRVGDKYYSGVTWTRADKRPGTRKLGWEMMRKMIRDARPRQEGLPREHPGLFIQADNNPQWLRTVLSLPRSEKDLDDVDTDAEDHAGDMTRYTVRWVGTGSVEANVTGLH